MIDPWGRLLVIDDDELFVSSLVKRFCPLVVNLEVVSARPPAFSSETIADVVIFNTHLAATEIVNLVRDIRKCDASAILIARATFPRGVEAVLLFEAGVDDYVAASDDLTLIEARILRAITRRRECESSGLEPRTTGVHELDPDANLPEELALTRLEERLWRTLRRARGELVTIRSLAEVVWKRSDVDPKLVYEHISKLRARLADRGWVIENCRSVGYRLVAAETRQKRRA
jgi:DNA-binding response OmpR family regulator